MSASCLYEPRVISRVPRVAFDSNEVGEQQWSVVAVARPHSLCVAAANMLHIILDISKADSLSDTVEEPGHSGVPIVFEFKCSVDAVGWSSDGVLLVAGDRQGVLHFVSPAIEKVLFSQGLESAAVNKNEGENEPVFKAIKFAPTLTEGVMDLLVLCSSGVVFIFRNVGIRKIIEAMEKSDGEALKKLRGEIELIKLDLSDVHSEGSSSLHPLGLGSLSSNLRPLSLITCGTGESALCVWQRTAGQEGSGYVLHDNVGCLLQGLGIVKCETTRDDRFLATLDSSGMLEVWLLSSLIVVNVWTSSEVKHFSLCQGLPGGTTVHSESTGCTDRLCLITESSAGKQELRIVSLPDFDPIHSMPVASAAALFTGTISEDSLYYLDIDDSEEKSAIVVKQLVLALPENRLATLLSQQKFEEAEAFARKFDLDPEMVYKSKAKVLNGLLCRAGDEEESETATTSLFRCLGHIKENAFVVNLVLCSLYPTLESTLQLLQFTHKKLQRGGSKSNDTSSIKAKVALALNKLVTFQMIDSDERFNPQAWQLFQEGTLLQHLRHYLQLGDLQKAGCIWSRHSTGLVNELDANNLLPLLECIPDSVPSLLLTSWLAQNIVPFLLQHVPQALRGFLLFVEERVRLLELTEKEHWPKNGLNMSSTLIESITSFRNPAAKMAIQPHSLSLIDFSDDHSSPLSSLRTLQKRLNDLCYLHSSLKCPITLSDHEKESQEAVVFRLLDEVIAAELVTTTIRSKVIPYVDRHKLQLDTTLLNYIKLFLSHSPRYSTGLTDSPFESKAIALVQAIQDKELYVLGCVELLKHVHTPWSESVEDLVQECLKVDHPVGVAMLEKQYSLLQLKKLLHGYGIRDFNFSDTSKGWLYIRRILISEGSSVLEDALKVGEMYQLDVSDIYKHHLMNLGQRDNMGEASQLLESLGREEQVTAAQKTFSLASSVLHLPFSAEMDDPDEYIGAAKVSVLCLKTLDTALKEGRNCVLCEDWTSMLDLINLFQRLLALQVEFSLFLSPAELGDGRKCRQLFTERVKHLPTVILSQPTDNSAKHYHDAIRYCHLLGFSEEEFYEELALVCAKQNKQDQAMDVCWDLVKSSPQPSVALVVMAIVQEVWERALSQPESINREDIRTVRQLAAYATALCHQSALLDTVEMYRLCVFIDCLYQQCESGVGEDRNNSDFLEWRWSPRFKEDGLILDQSALLSTALRYTLARLPLKPEQLKNRKTAALYCCPPRQAALSRGTIQSLLSITAQLSQVLQDNGHNQLTLQCSTQTLAAYSQHTATMAANSDSSSYPILQQGQSVNRELLNSLVTKILSSRRLDHDYALSLLLMLPPHLAVDKLKAIRTRNISSFSKVIALCKLTIDYSIMVDDPSVKDHSVAILTSAQWGKRLGGHKISFTEAFRGGMEEKKKVASTLFRSKHVDTELILDYCREMLKFDPQAALATYLRILLTEWEDIHACQERAAAVIRQMKNRDVVNQMLLNLLMNKIKPYDYDRIAFILSHLVGVGVATTAKPEQGLVLLDCLRRYTRVSPPSEYEKSLFSSRYAPQPTTEQEQPVEVALPAAALKHLPFHLLLYGAPMKVIEAELLSSANVEKLIPISRILQLPIDDFYCCAIKRIVTVSQQSNKGELDFPLLSQFLVKIQKFQYALEVCKWLAKQLPKEEDRTEILKSGLDLSMQYRSQATTEQEEKAADEKASMFHELWRIAQTDQVLKRHNLDTPEYLEMSRLGASLILTLYTDLPVARTTAMVPVHSIAAEIAKIHNINLDKIISKLTEKWLLSTNSSSTDMNVTQSSLLEDPTEDGSDVEESEETLNTRRLVYLLGVPEKLEKHSIMLLRWAQQTSSSAGSLSRVRALQILFTIAPSTLIERASGKSVTDIKDLMQSTMFVAELEALHMSTKISAFQACNKEGLVRTLWRNHSQEPRALRLICELCLYYHIRDPSLWANLLEQLLSLEMLPYLRHVLKVLASLSGLSNITSLASVWQRTLMSTFQGVAPPLSDYQKQEGTNTLEMMYSCPFPFELDVGEVVMGFCSVDLHTHALASLLIVPSQIERSRLLNRIMKCFSKKEQYVLLLDKLAGLCRTTCGHFKEAIELVYVYLNSSEKHELLLGSSHFTPFMHYLISKKLMKSLVTKTLQLNRVKDAVQLVEIYNSKHNPQTQIHGLDALQDYLTMNGINGFDASLLLYES